MSIDKRQVIMGFACLLIGAAIGFGASIPYAKSSAEPYHVGSFKGGDLLYKYDKRAGETWIAFREEGIGYRWTRVFDPVPPISFEEAIRGVRSPKSED